MHGARIFVGWHGIHATPAALVRMAMDDAGLPLPMAGASLVAHCSALALATVLPGNTVPPRSAFTDAAYTAQLMQLASDLVGRAGAPNFRVAYASLCANLPGTGGEEGSRLW